MAKVRYTVKRIGAATPKQLAAVSERTYEAARTEFRKYIRTTKRYKARGTLETGVNYSNPRLSDYNFTIVRS